MKYPDTPAIVNLYKYMQYDFVNQIPNCIVTYLMVVLIVKCVGDGGLKPLNT